MAGGKVLLSEGQLSIAAPIDLDRANCILEGQGEATIIQEVAAADLAQMLLIGADDVTVRDLVVDGNRANQSSAGHCIGWSLGTRWKILRVHVKSSYLQAMFMIAGALTTMDAEIAGCRFTDAGLHGINLEKCRRVRVHHNYLEDYGARVADYVGLLLTGSEQIEVDGNIIVGDASLVAANFPIQVKLACQDITVAHNVIVDSDDDAIAISGSNGVTVGKNVIVNPQGPGISVTGKDGTQDSYDVTIVGNTVRAAVGNGIAIDSQDGNVHDVVVMGNICASGARDGIIVVSGPTYAINRVLIQGNTARAHATGGFYGIETTGNGVVANTIRVYNNILNGNDTDVLLKKGTRAKDNEGLVIPDPGEAGAIAVEKGSGEVALITGYTAGADPAVTITGGGGGVATLTDTREDWLTDFWVGSTVTCNAQTFVVTGNIGDTLTGAGGWSGDPGADGQAWDLTSPGDMTRTLGSPGYVGQELTLYMLTDDGDCVVDCASGINAANETEMTFDAIGDTIWLKAVERGVGNLRWRVAGNDGVAVAP